MRLTQRTSSVNQRRWCTNSGFLSLARKSPSQTRNGTVSYLAGRMRDHNLRPATICGMADQELVFERAQWATLRASTPLELDDDDLAELRGINERLDLDEVAEIYLPLS